MRSPWVPLDRLQALYRSARLAVIRGAIFVILGQILPAQTAHKETKSQDLRALGLLQLSSKGKGYLIPVAIFYDGQFYDASAYKASPVPLALESGTVYEALHAGVSEGLFTVTKALQKQHSWAGEGKWVTAAELKAIAEKKAAATAKAAAEKAKGSDVDAPPVLHRGSAEKPKTPTAPTPRGAPSVTPTSPQAASSSPPQTSSPSPATPTSEKAEEKLDKNVPELKRGKPVAKNADEPDAAFVPARSAGQAGAKAIASDAHDLALIAAISDPAGPDPRPYAYEMKADEEAKLRGKMLALAADEVKSRIQQLSTATLKAPTAPLSRKATGATKPAQPTFAGVQMRVFDLSNSNEPVLVLTATAKLPQKSSGALPDLQYFVTVVGKSDIYGDLHKAFSAVTDEQHFDVQARLELIDAVDADGDGRGELLFRRISDAGTAFDIYRVIGYQLWPLFQGTPSE